MHDKLIYDPAFELDDEDRIELMDVKVLSDLMFEIQLNLAFSKGHPKRNNYR